MTELQHAGRVLVIAGSDSGGGAGIQADIKAVAAMGGYATTAITAVTAQNTLGVSAVHALPVEMVVAQIRAVLEDIGTDAIKTGMLVNAPIVLAVADLIASEAAGLPFVLDPVMIATSGDALLDADAETAIRERLLPLATLITPNIPEAERLAGGKIEDIDGQIGAAEALMEMGARAALVKGGHLSGSIARDVLVSSRGMEIIERPKVETRHTHGTGCTLASAIAALLARGYSLSDSVKHAGDYLYEAISRAPGFGAGHGPVDHMWMLKP